MAATKFYDKFPAEVLDFEVDCSPALPDGDEISPDGATVTCEGEAFAVDQSKTAIDASGKLVTVWCSGGTPGRVGKVIISIATVAGRFRQTVAYVVIKPL